MKVLIDECAPRALKTFLTNQGHESLTVQEAGWAGKENGELLNLAEADHFDALVTVDTKFALPAKSEGAQNCDCDPGILLESSGTPAAILSGVHLGDQGNQSWRNCSTWRRRMRQVRPWPLPPGDEGRRLCNGCSS